MEVTIRRTVVLRGIPVLGDNASEFFNACFLCLMSTLDIFNFEHTPLSTLLHEDNEDSPHCSLLFAVPSVSSAIIIDGGIVMDDVRDLPLAVCPLFGLSYSVLITQSA
ncbi:hypothetical protein QTP70_018083 [Hemibagrus guttatus]|uniref:Uncharacterized protein n=1 Tax=Hemibagrus guttatus TaxID=175788 RepID=A0AAE0R6E0_9TELE|nr:hypothetical protein QTP70_018083 [Hemibagrus guttatus]